MLVEGTEAEFRGCFAAIAPLQPIEWRGDGLVCAPRAAPDGARDAIERCPLPVRAVEGAAVFPTPPSAWIGGWYRRSPEHAPAPAGIGELIQVDGEGFGLGDHPTTELCLESLPAMPDGAAVDVGCGSGLLAQAWAASGRGGVLAVDLDPRAVSQARASAEAAGFAARISFRVGPAEALEPDDLASRVLLANIPPPAHDALLGRVEEVPLLGVMISGVRAGEGSEIAARYRRGGLEPAAVVRHQGWECWALVRA